MTETRTVQKVGAYKIVSRRGRSVASRIVTRRIERFNRRNGLAPVAEVEIRFVEHMMYDATACVGSQRVIAGD